MKSKSIVLVLSWLFATAPSAHAAPAWTSPFALDQTSFEAVMGTAGTTVYPGVKAIDGANRAVVRVRPPGGPLGPAQVLGPSPSGLAPEIAAGPGGRFLAAWVESGVVMTAVMLPGASSFGAVRAMPLGSDAASSALSASVDAAGNGHVLWSGFQSGVPSGGYTVTVRYGRRPADDALSQSTTLLASSGTTTPSDSRNFSGLSIAAGPADTAVASWQLRQGGYGSPSGETTTMVAALRSPGGGFAAPVTLDTATYSSYSSMMAMFYESEAVMNAGGTAAVRWDRIDFNGSTSTYAIRVRMATPTGFATPTQNAASGAAADANGGRIAIDDSGRLYAGWVGTVGGVRRAQVTVRSPSTGAFGPAQTLPYASVPASTFGLGVSPDGHALAAFVSGGGSGCAYYTAAALPGGTFGDVSPLGTAFSSSCFRPVVSLRPGGDGVLAMRGVRGGAYSSEAAGRDVSGPDLAGLEIPSGAQAGVATAFSVAPVDVWGTVAGTSWAFGDGATAEGLSVTHAFDAPGDRTVAVTATDSFGNTASASGPVAVVAPSPAPGGTGLSGGDAGGGSDVSGSGAGGSSSTADVAAPVISAFAMANRVFAVGADATALVAARKSIPRGTAFRYVTTEAGMTKIAIARRFAGRQAGNRCVRPSAGNRGAKRCSRWKAAGTLTRGAAVGPNRVAFSGRLGTAPLPRGRYRAALVVTDAAGNASNRVVMTFRIVKRR